MGFPLNVYVASFAAGAAGSALSLPLWRQWCRRHGLVDDPGHRKIHAEPMPLAGGLAVLTGMLFPLLAGAALAATHAGAREFFLRLAHHMIDTNEAGLLQYGFNKRALQLTGMAAGAAGMLAVGLRDDRAELAPAAKFAAQLLCALVVAAVGVRVTLFVHSVVFS